MTGMRPNRARTWDRAIRLVALGWLIAAALAVIL